MGYTEEQSKEAYEICGKNEEKAANYLIDNFGQARTSAY